MANDEKKQRVLTGDIIPKNDPLPISKPGSESFLNKIPIGPILESYAKRRRIEIETKEWTARAQHARSIADYANAILAWEEVNTKLDKSNIKDMKTTVKNTITAELEESELRVKQTKADIEIFDLEHKARIARLEANTAKADLEKKRAEDELTKPPEPAKEKDLLSREQRLDALYEKILILRKEFERRQEEEGGELSDAEHAIFVKREAIIVKEIQDIEETPER